MAKEVPAAVFRQPPPAASTSDMAAFMARAASPSRQLAVVPEPTAPKEEREELTAKSATILVPMPPANVDGSWRSKTVRRVDGRELRKQTFYLEAGVSQRLAQHCAKYRYEQSKAVERAVLALLEACGD
jgi:hypothetical protein